MTSHSFSLTRASARFAAAAWLICAADPGGAVARETVPGRLAGGMAYARYDRFNGDDVLGHIRRFDVGRWQVGTRQAFCLRRWEFIGEVRRVQTHHRFAYDDGTTIAGFAPDAAFTALAADVSPPNRFVSARSSAQLWDGNVRPPTWNLAFRTGPLRSLSVGLEIGRASGPPLHWTVLYANDGGMITWAGRTLRRAWNTRWVPASDWTLAARFTELRFEPDPGRAVADAAFSVQPSGTLWQRQLELEKVAASGLRCIVGFLDVDLYGRLDGLTEGGRFGQLGVIEATWQQWRAALEHRGSWSVQLLRGQGQFYTAGVIKAWPFTEGLAALLGSKRNLIADGRANVWILKTCVGWRLTPWAKATLDVHGYRIMPDLQMLTWQPLAFGMGIDDPRRTRLNVIRADIASVKLHWEIQIRRKTTVSTSLQQWLPVSVKKAALAGPPSDADEAVAKASYSLGKGLAVSVGLQVEW